MQNSDIEANPFAILWTAARESKMCQAYVWQ